MIFWKNLENHHISLETLDCQNGLIHEELHEKFLINSLKATNHISKAIKWAHDYNYSFGGKISTNNVFFIENRNVKLTFLFRQNILKF